MPNNYALTRSSKDQMGQEVILPIAPQRIISLVPSQTELLFDLGLDREIIGLTRFCVHPTDKVFLKTRIGGTKDFDFETIKSLEPDLIIGNYSDGNLVATLLAYYLNVTQCTIGVGAAPT